MGQSAAESACLEELRERELEGGGFPLFPRGPYRPDATAWAVLALASAASGERDREAVASGRFRLAESQLADGRVAISPSNPDAFWPTALAILAWRGSGHHSEAQSRAVEFLLTFSGRHWTKEENSPLGHDTSIRGWSWTENSHSWVEPTSLSILALRIQGLSNHARVQEGIRLLMDRQLPSGGWNYGNTLTYGTELHPQPDCTGLALSALAGCVPESEVGESLKYLRSRLAEVRTPLSLGWGVLGLAAWGKRPGQAGEWLQKSVRRQARAGPYDTTLISLLFLAMSGKEGLASLLGGPRVRR